MESKNYQNTADEVAEMWNVVHIGKSAGDDNIFFPRYGEDRFFGGDHLDCKVANVLVLGCGRKLRGPSCSKRTSSHQRLLGKVG